MRPSRYLALSAAAAAVAALVALAAPARADDPPGVARVSLIEGTATYFRADGDDWTGVDVNAPLVTGDRFFSGPGSRAEIQLAPGVFARLGADTELDLVELAPGRTQVQVPLGRASIRVRADPRPGTSVERVEIDTPSVALVVQRRGVYRVEVEVGGRTAVRVHEGAVVAYADGASLTLGAASEAVAEGVGDEARVRRAAYAGRDDFDAWEHERNLRVAQARSYEHLSRDIYGGEDLDESGEWEYRRGYGYLWRPAVVPAGWGPYSTGRWIWVEPWGWTWLDEAVWGWAPFHYGRWVYLDRYWYWAPGPVIAHPVYAPALVAWYGYGLGVSVSVSVGFGPALGWVALGWGEPLFPWWHGFGVHIGYPWWGGWGGPRVVNHIHVDNRTIVHVHASDVHFTNLRHPGGFSTVPVRDLHRGHGGRIPIGGSIRGASQPISGRVPVAPSRANLRAVRPSRRAIGERVRPPLALARVPAVRAPLGRGGRLGPSRSGSLGREGRTRASLASAAGPATRSAAGPRVGVGGRSAAAGREGIRPLRLARAERDPIARGARAPGWSARASSRYVARRPLGAVGSRNAGFGSRGASGRHALGARVPAAPSTGAIRPSGSLGRRAVGAPRVSGSERSALARGGSRGVSAGSRSSLGASGRSSGSPSWRTSPGHARRWGTPRLGRKGSRGLRSSVVGRGAAAPSSRSASGGLGATTPPRSSLGRSGGARVHGSAVGRRGGPPALALSRAPRVSLGTARSRLGPPPSLGRTRSGFRASTVGRASPPRLSLGRPSLGARPALPRSGLTRGFSRPGLSRGSLGRGGFHGLGGFHGGLGRRGR